MEKMDNKLLTEEELKEQLLEIRQSNVGVAKIKESYGIPAFAVSDLRQMNEDEFKKFMTDITSIREEMLQGKKYLKIASEHGIGSNIVMYVGKKSVENFNSGKVKDEYYNYIKKIEEMWKKSLLGEDEYRLSREYNMPVEEVEERVQSYNNLIERYQVRFCNAEENTDAIKHRLKQKFFFGDDTLSYIFGNKNVFNSFDEKYTEYEDYMER